MKNNQKKKTNKVLPWVLLIVVSAIVGVFMGIFFPDLNFDIQFFHLIILFFTFFLSLPIHIILHEVGHLIGGLLSGYQFIMFRLFNTVWIKTTDGLSRRHQVVQGILGQALMVPPEGEDHPPFLLYHSSGLLMNLLTAILLIILANAIAQPMMKLILIVSAASALLLMIVNLVPMKPNDGYNILEQYKRPEATLELTNILRLYADMVKGVPFTDLQHYIHLDEVESIEDPNNVTLYTAQAAAHFEQFDFEGARAIYENVWAQRDLLIDPHKPEVYLNYLFSLYLTDPHHPDVAAVKETDVYKNYSKMKLADSLKVLASEAIYVDGDYTKASALLAEGKPMINHAPTLTEENLERKLYEYLEGEIVRLEETQQSI